jgi:hypothetical protein
MRKFMKILSVILLPAGIVMIVVSLIASQSYGKTTGEIISTMTSDVGFDIHNIQYTVDGVEYIGSRQSSGESIGDTLTVYYNKSTPSVLETPVTQLMPIGAIVLVLGVVSLILAFRKKKG